MVLSGLTGDFPKDFLLEATLGNITGYDTEFIASVTPLRQTSEGELTVWDGDTRWVPLTANTEMFASSSSASDTGGTSVLVIGLDDNNDRTTTITELTGQTQVSVGFFTHVQNVSVITTAAVGDIYVASSGPVTGGVPNDLTTVQSKIIAGLGITHNGFFKVPRGKSAVGMAIRATTDSNNKAAKVKTYITPLNQPTVNTVTYSIAGGPLQWSFPIPVATADFLGQLAVIVPEESIVEFTGVVDTNNTEIFFGIDFLVIDAQLLALK